MQFPIRLFNIIVGIIIAAFFLIVSCAYFWKLPLVEIPEPSVFYDINNKPITGIAEQNRIYISFEEIPASFKSAIIAVEDKNFYKHHGLDLSGVLRALYTDIKERDFVEGGSTITQQTAKTIFLSNEKTISRKIKELYYALLLERYYTKDEILSMYCNTIYFGHGAYGLEVAARTYFGKSAEDLTLSESALLAGLPRWPQKYDPYSNPGEAKKRQEMVLHRMLEDKKISQALMQQAVNEKMVYHKALYNESDAPYFAAMVKDYLAKKYGERTVYQGGLQVYTSLDLDMQKAANIAYNNGLKGQAQDLQAALVAVDVSNGQIRALIGGRNFATSSYNRAFSLRQPGSTFKPFMYSLAIDSGLTPADMLTCEEVDYPLPTGETYIPTDYGDQPYHWREFTLKEAVMISDNVIAVQVNNMLDPQEVANHAEKFGFKNIQPVLSLPLGSNEVKPIDMAVGYAVFADQGIYCQPVYVLKVLDKNGLVLEENNPSQQRIIGADNAYIITDMLEGVMQPGGTGAHLKSIVGDVAVAGKTGTTEQRRDAWFVGYTPRLSCAVWVGYDKDKNVNQYGGTIAGPIWANFIHDASAKLNTGDFARPDNIITENICLDSGQVAGESCPRTIEMTFKSGTEPTEICPLHSSGSWITP